MQPIENYFTMLLREIKNIFHVELDKHYAKEEVDSFFYILIEDKLQLERFALVLEPNLIISKEQETILFEGLSRLKVFEPIQYITGKAYFMDLDFVVDKNVLIPRPETEELVRWILEKHNVENNVNSSTYKLKILDIGTGSGCIAISIAKYLERSEVYGLDISESALQIAKGNAAENMTAVTFMNTDILEVEELEDTYDVIVSNPPYVREIEKKEMHQNVLEHEPELALFVANENPLKFYEKIVALAAKNLNKNGMLYFEVNQYLPKETEQLLRDYNFTEIELKKDMFNNYRMLRGKR